MHFTPSHEWIEIREDGLAYCGISTHAQHELGPIVYVELPKVGAKVSQGGVLAVLESSKAAADVYSPVTGSVVALNPHLATEPMLINSAPQGQGWLCALKLDASSELQDLMTADAYLTWLELHPF